MSGTHFLVAELVDDGQDVRVSRMQGCIRATAPDIVWIIDEISPPAPLVTQLFRIIFREINLSLLTIL